MGACISTAKDPGASQAGLPSSVRVDAAATTANAVEPANGTSAVSPTASKGAADKPKAPVVAPVRVFRDDMEIGVKVGATAQGTVQFTVTDTLEEAQQAAGRLQATYQAQGDANALENLQLLLSMGIEMRYCSSNPFIGKLTLRFLSVSETNHAKSTYIKVHLEGDRTVPLFAEGTEGEAAMFNSKPLIFVIIHSNAVAHIKVRDKKEGTQFYGQARLAVKDIAPGTNVMQLLMYDPKDPARRVAAVQAEVCYEYLRGTTDEGMYFSPSRVQINKRKLRALAGLGAASTLVNHISQQNHWVLSHDNVWPPSSTYFAAEEEKRKEAEATTLAEEEEEKLQGPARMLMTHTQRQLRGNSPAERYNQAVQDARRNVNNTQKASKVMNEGMLLEALGPKEGEAAETADFKKQLLALMLALHERVDRTEAIQEQQNLALQELLKETQAGKSEKDNKSASLELAKAEPFISGTFEYGLGRTAASRKVYLFINKSQDQRNLHDAMVQFLGVYKTNKKGQLNGIPVPEFVWATPGHYSVVALLPEDHTYAKGSLFILAPGTKCVVFDMDGTITIGDIGVVTQFAIDSLAVSTAAAQNLSHKYDIKARHSALTCVRAWAAKGYQPIYVSGRQGSYYNLTMEWLVKHNYPPGPIHLTRTHLPTLPIYYSVGNFKVEYMEGLKAKGLELFAAYGNTVTDIRAYVASGIPLERIYMIGPHGGKGGSVKIDNFTDHIPDIFAFPDADPPIPYTELLFTAVPGYKKARRPATKRTEPSALRADSVASVMSGTSTYPSSNISSEALSSQDLEDALDDDIDEDGEAEAEAQVAEGNTDAPQPAQS